MEDKPKNGKLVKAFLIPVGIATLVAGAILVIAPEIGYFAAASAWIGIVLTLGVWGMVT